MPPSDIIGHQKPKAFLKAAVRHNRLAHAYLFHGEPHIGKRSVATWFIQTLLCDRSATLQESEACGTCRTCRHIDASTYPDVMVITPETDRATPIIKIEQIRELEQQIIYRPLLGERKVCVIDDADRLNLNAANALLKTLEEPPGHSLFLLITSRPGALPATIRSRCHALRFSPPARADVEAALIRTRNLSQHDARMLAVLAEGRIGQALNADLDALRTTQREFTILTSPETLGSIPTLLSTADMMAKGDRGGEALGWIARWVRDVVLFKLGVNPESLLYDQFSAETQHLISQASMDQLLGVLDAIETIHRNTVRNINLHLALESVLLRLAVALGLQQDLPQPIP